MSSEIDALKAALHWKRVEERRIEQCWDAALAKYPDDAELAELMGRPKWQISGLRAMRAPYDSPLKELFNEL